MLNGYILELVASTKDIQDNGLDAEIQKKNIVPQSELQQVLVLLGKESSLDVVAQEIILKCVNTSNSDFGLIVFQDERNILDFLFHDPNNFIEAIKRNYRE